MRWWKESVFVLLLVLAPLLTWYVMRVPPPLPLSEPEPTYALCSLPERRIHPVTVDSLRRVVICGEIDIEDALTMRATPVVRRVADTLEVSAIRESDLNPSNQPEQILNMVVPEPFQVVYGPLPSGARLRVTTKRWPGNLIQVDTVVRVP